MRCGGCSYLYFKPVDRCPKCGRELTGTPGGCSSGRPYEPSLLEQGPIIPSPGGTAPRGADGDGLSPGPEPEAENQLEWLHDLGLLGKLTVWVVVRCCHLLTWKRFAREFDDLYRCGNCRHFWPRVTVSKRTGSKEPVKTGWCFEAGDERGRLMRCQEFVPVEELAERDAMLLVGFAGVDPLELSQYPNLVNGKLDGREYVDGVPVATPRQGVLL